MRQILFSVLLLMATASSGLLAGNTPKPDKSGHNRIVRVVTVTQAELQRESTDLFEETMARLNQAASFKPDIACLPELFPNRPPESVPGPVTERLAAWAREHSSYVIFGMKTKTGGKVYNSAVLIDRKGQVRGQYSKIHPTEVEVAWFHDDDWWTLASLDPDLTVEDIISEFGLTPLSDYRVRATAVIDKARADAAVPAAPGR